jgi:hypothetical protein
MERAHKRNMQEMQERHEQQMAEWRAEFAQAEWRIAEPTFSQLPLTMRISSPHPPVAPFASMAG